MEKPIYFDPNRETLQEFKIRVSPRQVIDAYKELLEELFLIRNPQHRFHPNYKEPLEQFLIEHPQGKPLEECGNWVYFPWSSLLIHFLPDELHQELRTARNRNIISKDEQQNYYNAVIAVAGLSVGSHAALTLSMMGASRRMKIADPDTISGSNLNRIRYDFTMVGKGKCEAVAEKLYQMDPYGAVEAYPEGLNDNNMGQFLSGASLLIEEMDDLGMKIKIREEARKCKIPVLMATDNGDGVIVDIERYDLEPNLKLFNGLAGDISLEEFKKTPPQEIPKLSTKIAGQDLVHPRMQSSLLEVGKTLYSWPQLGDAATLSGVALAYVAKRIVLGESLKSGKFEINLDATFDPTYHTPKTKAKREQNLKAFHKALGLE